MSLLGHPLGFGSPGPRHGILSSSRRHAIVDCHHHRDVRSREWRWHRPHRSRNLSSLHGQWPNDSFRGEWPCWLQVFDRLANLCVTQPTNILHRYHHSHVFVHDHSHVVSKVPKWHEHMDLTQLDSENSPRCATPNPRAPDAMSPGHPRRRTRIGGLRAVEGPLQNATQDPRLRQGVEVDQPPAVEKCGKYVENLCRINFYVDVYHVLSHV